MSDAFVGAETGALKRINFAQGTFTNVNQSEPLSTDKKIDCMCWADDTQTSILCCLSSRQVKLYDCSTDTYEQLFSCEGGSGDVVGVGLLNDEIVTCVMSGELKLFDRSGEEKFSFTAGGNLFRMRQNPRTPNVIATGGRENDLKVRDLNSPEKPIFTAKNVHHDSLNLRVPVWIRDLRFVSNDVVATCTAHYQIRGYDLRSGRRRPFVDIKFGEHPITSLACWQDSKVLAGNGVGELSLFDLKTGRLVCAYKGFSGGIRCVECHETEPYVATCGLDRFVRLHHVQTRKLVNRVYCKSRLTAILLPRNLNLASSDGVTRVKSESGSSEESDDSSRESGGEENGGTPGRKKAKT